MIDPYLFIKIHLLFVDNLGFELCKKIQYRFLVHCVPDERMFEQLFDIWPLVWILHQTELEEVIEVLGPPGGMIQSWRI